MGEKANRNKPCPCGSGKKYKNCCSGKGLRFAKKDRSKMIIWIIAGIGIIIAAVVISNKFSPSSSQPAPIISQPFNGQFSSQQSGSVPQPGPAPPGKVWAPEHGHWHDAPGTATTTTPSSFLDIQSAQPPAQLSPQPFGPAPEGKVWSPEHGHWHDAQQTPIIKVIDPKSTPSDP
ncbi:MAG: SEC-C domain-containing protein [candidate division Zixibacteria bacterium]|nr:SEC-C domain-containing protein [candidate division Zixibacteria bacterium]